jgi:glycosyltransferase involved in cell wall biosynthesis
MAATLRDKGHRVEVFATCTTREDARGNDTPHGTTVLDGIPVHRFRIDEHDPLRLQEIIGAIRDAKGEVSVETEQEYLRHSIHSARLMDALRARRDEFATIITGPYLSGLTADVATEFRAQTLVVPCFHDEPVARLRLWPRVYGQAGGILYHSPEEQAFAEAELGVNSPGGIGVGTHLITRLPADPDRGRKYVATQGRYVVYCGRYVAEKGLVELLDYAQRYTAEQSGRYTFVFVGQGNVLIPAEKWARDLGFVNESIKHEVLAGADGLIHLSPFESLSLVALEAWAQGIPVISSAQCDVLNGHLRRGRGGQSVSSYETFKAALDDLWEKPERWRALGRKGQAYVQAEFGSATDFAHRLETTVTDLSRPLAERMRQHGMERAAQFSRRAWREQFAAVVEESMDAPARPHREQIEVEPRAETCTVVTDSRTVLVPVRIGNRGDAPGLEEGPARVVVRAQVIDCTHVTATAVPLPAILLPGQALHMAIPVEVPPAPGSYQIALSATRTNPRSDEAALADGGRKMRLMVAGGTHKVQETCTAPFLAELQRILVEAQRLQTLPIDYTDVTHGRFAKWKAWVKRKLLGNFKSAYVDVLSRRQTAFNHRMLAAIHELTACCATLDSASRLEKGVRPDAELAEAYRQIQALTERIVRLEAMAAHTMDVHH